MRLLHIDSSALRAQSSVTRALSAAIVARWQDALPGLAIDYRDLDAGVAYSPQHRTDAIAGALSSIPAPLLEAA